MTCPPVERRDIEKRLQNEFDIWFAKLQNLSELELDPDDWTERWFDGYTPAAALEAGPPE